MLRRLVHMANSNRRVTVGRRLSSLAVLLALLVSTLVAVYCAGRPAIPGWAALSAFIGFTSLGIVLAQIFYDLEGWFEQKGRDLEAARVWQRIQDGRPTKPFVLYLRPFISTNQIAAEDFKLAPVRSAPGGPVHLAPAMERVEFEEEVEQALRRIGPVIALGKPLEHMGAGRIEVTDKVWQDAIGRLMDEATLVVLLPSPRPGTSWEIERLISSGHLQKTILIDPPNEAGSSDASYDPVEEWAGVRESFSGKGYQLPEDAPEGQLIWFGQSNMPLRAEKMSLAGGKSHIRAFAHRILHPSRPPIGATRELNSSHA